MTDYAKLPWVKELERFISSSDTHDRVSELTTAAPAMSKRWYIPGPRSRFDLGSTTRWSGMKESVPPSYFCLDEENGDDANDGTSIEQAVKTRKRLNALIEERAQPRAVDVTIWWDGGKWHYGEVERAQ